MNCKEVSENLTALLKDELDASEEAAIKQHIAECRECHEEMKSLEVALSIIHNEMAPVEAPEGFSARLMEKITSTDAPKANIRRSASERHYSNLSMPLSQRIAGQAKRSPYFAISLLLHAAAAIIVVALLVGRDKDNTTKITHSSTITQKENRDEIRLNLPSPAFLERADRPAIVLTGLRMKSGDIKINIAQFAADTVLTLAPDKSLGCIKAYYKADGIKGITCKVTNSELDIPEKLASTLFAKDLRMRVIEMKDRLEIWPQQNWLGITPGIQATNQIPARTFACALSPVSITARRRFI